MRPKELELEVAARQGRICDELILQYDNLMHVLSVTIRPLSRKQWVSGNTPADTPARQAAHIVGACDGYATGVWDICTCYFGVPIGSLDEQIPAGQLPTVSQMLDTIGDVRQHVHAWLGKMNNDELLGPAPNPGWSQRGWTMLGHAIYVLRHGTLHLGHLRATLRERNVRYGVFK